MISHVLPYGIYVAPAALAGWLPEPLRPWADPLRVAACAVALAAFRRRGAYPELDRVPAAHRGAVPLALLAGVAVAVLWMPLAELVPRLGARGGFDPGAAGADAAPWLWTARIAGFVLVVPLAEELLVRSLLPRWIDATEAWRTRAVASFTPLSAAASVAFFAGTHPEWLAALAAGALWTALLARTRRLRDTVLAHAVANALLAAWWLRTGDTSWW